MKWRFSVCVHRSFFSRGVVLNYDSSCFHEVRCHVNGSWSNFIIFNMHLCAMQMHFQILTILNNARVHCATNQNKLVRSDGYLLVFYAVFWNQFAVFVVRRSLNSFTQVVTTSLLSLLSASVQHRVYPRKFQFQFHSSFTFPHTGKTIEPSKTTNITKFQCSFL